MSQEDDDRVHILKTRKTEKSTLSAIVYDYDDACCQVNYFLLSSHIHIYEYDTRILYPPLHINCSCN